MLVVCNCHDRICPPGFGVDVRGCYMKRAGIGLLRLVGFVAVLAVAACDDGAAPPATSAPVAGAEIAAPAPVAVTPPPANLLGGTQRWSITNNGTVTGEGTVGKASLAPTSILSIVAEKAPVAIDDTITVKAIVTAPANRPFRIYAMRHCDNENGGDTTTADYVGTGTPIPVEVTHTFKANYACMRLSLTSGDKLPMDVELKDVYFIKVPKG
jgi:hypothetical protein